MEEEKVRRLLMALVRARSPVTLEYILLHSNVDDPVKFLEMLEEKGLVKKVICSDWSPCMNPRYQLVSIERLTI